MADVMKYDPRNKKADALVKAGLMEGGPQPVAKEEPRKQQEKVQAP